MPDFLENHGFTQQDQTNAAIKSYANTIAAFYRELRDNHIPASHTLTLTKTFIHETIQANT